MLQETTVVLCISRYKLLYFAIRDKWKCDTFALILAPSGRTNPISDADCWNKTGLNRDQGGAKFFDNGLFVFEFN